MNAETRTIDVPGGAVEVRHTGGDAPAVIFVHGAIVDGRLWDRVWPAVAAAGYRCVMPNLPLGAHRIPLAPGADLTPTGQADRIAALIEALRIGPAVVVGNDTGGALSQILTARYPEAVDRLILTSSDAFEHFPPKMFKALPLIARSPRALRLSLKLLGSRQLRNTPLGFGLISKRPLPGELFDQWLRGIDDPGVLRDLAGFAVAIRPQLTIDAAEGLRAFPRPVLLAWSAEDPLFPYSDAIRLAGMLQDARLEPIADSYCFSMLDQPEALAGAITRFLGPA